MIRTTSKGETVLRPFCIRVQYPGKEPFLLYSGRTFFVEGDRPLDHEVRDIMEAHVKAWCSRHFPDNMPHPDFQAVLWGHLIFVPDDSA